MFSHKTIEPVLVVLACLSMLPASGLSAETRRVLPEASTFAVVTHKAGVGARLAHDHLVVAAGYEAKLGFDPQVPLQTSFEIEIPVDELVVDEASPQQRLYPRLEELGVLTTPFKELSTKNRGKIRDSMLGPRQLDSASFPGLSARLAAVEAKASELGGTAFPYEIALDLTLRGQAREVRLAARFEMEGERIVVEALGRFQLSDFGIEPYSAMLGAVKNSDEMHLYVYLVAEP